MMGNKRVHAIVHGRVQGVFFREYTRRKAEQLGLNGWVRNLSDGTVETVIQGEPVKVTAIMQWLYTGSPQSEVAEVDIHEEETSAEPLGFTIRY